MREKAERGSVGRGVMGNWLIGLFLLALALPASALTPQGVLVGSGVRIGAVIHSVELGQIEAEWRTGETRTTARGDTVIWGIFYASPADVGWGDSGNPDLYVKIWLDVSGRVDVNFFHVSVPDIEVYSSYGDTSGYRLSTLTQTQCRYVRHYYQDGQASADGPCAGNTTQSQLMLQQVNAARASARTCGSTSYPAAAPLVWSSTLAAAAQKHSNDMAQGDFFSHTGSDGSTVGDRVTSQGYQYRSVGENIAAGFEDADSAVAALVNSPGHCANIMNSGFVDFGGASATNGASTYGIYWTQVFGTSR